MGERGMIIMPPDDIFFPAPDTSGGDFSGASGPDIYSPSIAPTVPNAAGDPAWMGSISKLLGSVAGSTAAGLASGGLAGATKALQNATTGTVRAAVTPTLILVGLGIMAVLFFTLKKKA